MTMSIMVTGENSPMTHSVRTCITMKMRKTTENHTTTIPTALWYCKITCCVFVQLNTVKTAGGDILKETYKCYRLKLLQRAQKNTTKIW